MRILTPNTLRNQPAGDNAAPRRDGGGDGSSRRGLSRSFVTRQLRFVLFLAAIVVVFIWNSHLATKRMREYEALKRDVKRLRDDYMMKVSTLSAGTSYATITAAADTLGLAPPPKPPFRIVKEGAQKAQKKEGRGQLTANRE